MPQSPLGSVLGSSSARIVAVLQDLNPLAVPVGDQPFGPLGRELTVEPGNVSLFDWRSGNRAAMPTGRR